MKLYCLSIIIFVLSIQVYGQNQAQLLFPRDFTINVNSSVSEFGKGICLEIEKGAPTISSKSHVTSQENIFVTVEGYKTMTFNQAVAENIISLTQNGFRSYFFRRGSNYNDRQIDIKMKGELGDFVAVPVGKSYDITRMPSFDPQIMTSQTFSIDKFQGDYWWYQLKRDVFNVPNARLVTDLEIYQIKHKNAESFWSDFHALKTNEKFCDVKIDQICITNDQIPEVSFTIENCKGLSFTISTSGEMTMEATIEGRFLSISQGYTVQLHEEIQSQIDNQNCTWKSICINLDDFIPISISTKDCDINFDLSGSEVRVDFEENGVANSYSFEVN